MVSPKTPNDPFRRVLPSPNISHAPPTRGTTSFQVSKFLSGIGRRGAELAGGLRLIGIKIVIPLPAHAVIQHHPLGHLPGVRGEQGLVVQLVIRIERIVEGLDLIWHSLAEKKKVIAGGLVLQRLRVAGFPRLFACRT